jgi:hypothetical protein
MVRVWPRKCVCITVRKFMSFMAVALIQNAWKADAVTHWPYLIPMCRPLVPSAGLLLRPPGSATTRVRYHQYGDYYPDYLERRPGIHRLCGDCRESAIDRDIAYDLDRKVRDCLEGARIHGPAVRHTTQVFEYAEISPGPSALLLCFFGMVYEQDVR